MARVHMWDKRFKNAPTERVDPSRVRQGWLSPGRTRRLHTASERVCNPLVRPWLGQRAARCEMAGVEWSARRTSRSAMHHQDDRSRPHERAECSECIVLVSIDGAKPPLSLYFALDSPPATIPVPSRQRSGRQDGSSRASRRDACDTQDVASDVRYDGHPDGTLRIERMPAF